MRRLVQAIAVLAALTALVTTAAAAGGNAMRASLEGGPSVFGPPTGCPAGFDWLATIYDAGTGTMTSDAYTGAVTWTGEHCTRLLLPVTQQGHDIGKVDGTTTIVAPDGTLYLDFQGTWVLTGTVPVAFHTDAMISYTITGGTGVFANATGHGHMDVNDEEPGGITLQINGALNLSD